MGDAFLVTELPKEENMGEKRIAIIGIFVEERDSVEAVNAVLHDNGQHIVGRMGVPYKDRGISVISLIVDATSNEINNICGKLGKIKGVSVKSVCAKNV